MPHRLPIGRLARVALVGAAAVFAIHLQVSSAAAQGGSTGGSIGKQDKSLSGGQDAPSTRSAPSSRKSSKSGGGGGGNYDGLWNSASWGKTCSDRTTAVVTIAGGRMTSEGFTGQVSGGGSVSGVWAGSGISASVTGRISGNSGSGTFRRSDGCVGSWTLSRQ